MSKIKIISIKNVITTLMYIVVAEVLLIPVYFICFILTGFNDNGIKIKNIAKFIPLLTPVIILSLFVIGVYFILNKTNSNKKIIKLIYLPVNILLISYILCCYVTAFTDIDLISVFNKKESQYEISNSIKSEELSNEEKKITEKLKTSYDLKYENGIIFRSGNHKDGLTWVFKRDGKVILERNAENEESLNLSSLKGIFSKSGQYSCYLNAIYEDEYKIFSNEVIWEIK